MRSNSRWRKPRSSSKEYFTPHPNPLPSEGERELEPFPVSEPAVQVEHLTHRYDDRVALDDVSLAVQPGEVFGLLGPNGSGKTTLFRILCTLVRPTAGAAKVLGADGVGERETVRRAIGVVFQSPSLDKQLTARENLRHHGHLYGLRG